MLFRGRLACSFCGKRASQVAKLVAGRRAYICDACAATALRLMSDSGSAPTAAEISRPGPIARIMKRLRDLRGSKRRTGEARWLSIGARLLYRAARVA